MIRISLLGGSDFSTFTLRRRSMSGFNSTWALASMTLSTLRSVRLKASSNLSLDGKYAGYKKFKSAQSSVRLF